MNLVDPIDKSPLSRKGDTLISTSGRTYPIIHDIPILLVPDVDQTIWMANASMQAISKRNDPYQLDTLGISEAEQAQLRAMLDKPQAVDPVVQLLIAAT